MTTPAYDSEELDLTDTERISARHTAAVATKQPTLTQLREALARDGADPALLDCALGLPLEQYRLFEADFKRAPRNPRARFGS